MIIIIMGVCGAGKTTVGKAICKIIHREFIDADDYHSIENKEKMRKGIALTDSDRDPWLNSLNAELCKRVSRGEIFRQSLVVLACSALKEKYRKLLVKTLPQQDVSWVYLKGDKALIQERAKNRLHAYMSIELLESQFGILEEPKEAVVIDIAKTVSEIVDEIIERLQLQNLTEKMPVIHVNKRI